MADHFLCSPFDDPFDAALMLIRADWLEERGDLAAAEVFRGLAEAGIASMAILALDSALVSVPHKPDLFWYRYSEGCGFASGDGSAIKGGSEFKDGDGFGSGDGLEDGDEGESGSKARSGYGAGDSNDQDG